MWKKKYMMYGRTSYICLHQLREKLTLLWKFPPKFPSTKVHLCARSIWETSHFFLTFEDSKKWCRIVIRQHPPLPLSLNFENWKRNADTNVALRDFFLSFFVFLRAAGRIMSLEFLFMPTLKKFSKKNLWVKIYFFGLTFRGEKHHSHQKNLSVIRMCLSIFWT